MSQEDMPDNQLIYWALNMWANWIETDDINMSATDAANMEKRINPLTTEQMRHIVRLRDLSHRFLLEEGKV